MSITRREFVSYSSALALAACGGAPKAKAPPVPKKILILGGTGFLGPQLVEACKARQHVVTLFNRGKTNPGLFPELEKLQGDRDGHLEALQGRRWDAVIDTSGYVPRIVEQSAKLLAPNVDQYVFVSTISVYDDPVDPKGGDESLRLAKLKEPGSEEVQKYYGALKALCEQAVEAALPGRTTNVRPGLIVGPGDPTDRFTYWPVRIARGGEVLAPGDGNDRIQFVDVHDLAAWIIQTIEDKTVGTYNAVGPAAPLTMGELLDACRTAAGSDARFTWVDAKWLESKEVSPWSDMPVWVPSQPDSMGFTRISSARAIAKGLRFRAPVDTCRDTLAWWATQPEERRAKLKSGISAEKEAELLAAWHQK
jgi:2'-hydroxyisoflavone reductase